MPTFFVHLGPGKTGSSHLQRFFAQNIDSLRRNGIHYPASETTAQEANGTVLSGNGYDLFVLAKKDIGEVRKWVRRIRNEADGADILVSSESLSLLSQAALRQLSREIGFVQYEPRFIYYLRPPLDIAVSALIQAAKGGVAMGHPADFISKHAGSLREDYTICDVRRRVETTALLVGREHLLLRLYDAGAFAGGCIETDMLDALGISVEAFTFAEGETNPSLSEAELQLLLEANARAGRRATVTGVNKVLMELRRDGGYDPGPPVNISERLLRLAAREFRDDLRNLTTTYGLPGIKAYSDKYAGRPKRPDPALYRDLALSALIRLSELRRSAATGTK